MGDGSQKVFVLFGIFVIDQNGKVIFNIFLKQQLINYHKNLKNKTYTDIDIPNYDKTKIMMSFR
jgi:hypothetical protein